MSLFFLSFPFQLSSFLTSAVFVSAHMHDWCSVFELACICTHIEGTGGETEVVGYIYRSHRIGAGGRRRVGNA